MSEQFARAIEQFQAREFYACHDTLEEIWHEAETEERQFYQGILQIAVGCYHLNNTNQRGALVLLGEGISRLRRYPASYGGINVEYLVATAIELLTALQPVTDEELPDFISNVGVKDLWPKLMVVDRE
jgi:uncharacterized protein